MKTIFLALCLFLLAYKATSSIILDTKGQPVSNNADAYYLVPVYHGNSGLGLAKVGNEAEPTAVVLDPNSRPGLTVRFSSPYLTLFLTEDFPLNIKFVPGSEVWEVTEEFPIGRTVRVSEEQTLFGPFKLQKVEGGYKIVYYHNPYATGEDIGLVPGEGEQYRLAVRKGKPFVFNIRKAVYDENSAGIMSIV